MVFVFDGPPAPNNPRVEFEQDPKKVLANVKSPKSCAFPVVAMVINCIVLVTPGALPPPKSPQTELEHPAGCSVATTKLPKSTAFAFDAIVI